MSHTLYDVTLIITVVVWILALVHIVAFLILFERKVLAMSQRRVGPVILGKRGFFQIIADVIKPLFKEVFETNFQALTLITFMVFTLLAAQLTYATFFQYGIGGSVYEDLEFVLFLQSFFGGVSTFATLLLGYLSKTKYGMLGSVRLVLAELSTETITFISNTIFLYTTSGLDYESVFFGQGEFCNLGVLGLIFGVVNLIHMFVSAQRAPLDLIENEGELVSGYNTEYSGPDVLVIYFSEYFHLFNAGLQFVFLIFGGFALFGVSDFCAEYMYRILSDDAVFVTVEETFEYGYAIVADSRFDNLLFI